MLKQDLQISTNDLLVVFEKFDKSLSDSFGTSRQCSQRLELAGQQSPISFAAYSRIVYRQRS
jgi:hypothetical protein